MEAERGPGEDVTYAILAGGQGRRLGRGAKGRVPFRGKPLIEHVLRRAPAGSEPLILSADADAYADLGQAVLPDVLPGFGAPGGVYSALCHARREWVLVVACDMPLIRPAAVSRLLAERTPDVEIICFEVAGRLEPLLGLYRKAIAPRWRERLGHSEPEPHRGAEPRRLTGASFRALLPYFATRVLSEATLAAVDPTLASVANVNTEAELHRLEAEGESDERT